MTLEQYLRDMHVKATELFPDVGFAFCAVEDGETEETRDITLMTNLDPDEVAFVGAQFKQMELNFDEGVGTLEGGCTDEEGDADFVLVPAQRAAGDRRRGLSTVARCVTRISSVVCAQRARLDRDVQDYVMSDPAYKPFVDESLERGRQGRRYRLRLLRRQAPLGGHGRAHPQDA